MPTPKRALSNVKIQPRIRILRGADIAFGPGKADLLGHIAETSSLNQAAKLMDMSYMRAWKLVQTMNGSFKKPLVKCERGGVNGGGAELTPDGQRVLELYREMVRTSVEAMAPSWEELRRRLKS